MQNLLSLASRLEKVADNLPKKINDGKKAIVLKIVSYLADITPVDTSNALSNWQVSKGSPISIEIDPYVPGYLGYTAAASARATVNAAEQALKAVNPGEAVFIANNAPYISDLNSGSSKQHPGGFVEAAILIGRLEINNIKVVFK